VPTKPKKTPEPSAKDLAWAVEASTSPSRCRTCREPGKAERCRALIAALVKSGRKVGFQKFADKVSADCGGKVLALNSIRKHLREHEPAWPPLEASWGSR